MYDSISLNIIIFFFLSHHGCVGVERRCIINTPTSVKFISFLLRNIININKILCKFSAIYLFAYCTHGQ